MKVSQLIDLLKNYPKDSNIELLFNPTKNSAPEYDINCSLDVMGSEETAPTLIMVPKDKPSQGFETLEELLSERPKKVEIDISNDGIFIFSDGQLRREMEFKDNRVSLEERSEEIIKRLIREL